MKLLAALSLLSSPYTWMMPPGRVPSPDVGDVLLAGKTGTGGLGHFIFSRQLDMVSIRGMNGQVPSTYLGALRAGLDAGPQLGKRERKGELAPTRGSPAHLRWEVEHSCCFLKRFPLGLGTYSQSRGWR